MLTHLRIHDFALLDDVELELGPGFNVLTGETGAGKSLLMEAVALLRGGRASADVVRQGAEEARIEAVFEPPHGPAADALVARLEVAGLSESDEGLIVRRVIGKNGRGRVFINNTLATGQTLAQVAGVLIELAGQHEHQTLVDAAEHGRILDRFGELDADLQQMSRAFEALIEARDALTSATLDERTRAEREDFLRFQLREIEDAALEVGEDERLKRERERLRAAEKLVRAARRGEDSIYSREGAIVEELGSIGRELSELGKIDPTLERSARQIDEARVMLEDAASDLRKYADLISADPDRLAEVEERMHLVSRLVRKHGESVTEILARREQMAEELRALEVHEERQAELVAALAQRRAEAEKIATRLTEGRRSASTALAAKVGERLAELGMRSASLHVRTEWRAPHAGDDEAMLFGDKKLTSTGWDRTEFLLASNVGAEARPIGRVASGGELSRVMLALKRVLARADEVATYVFDEVDAGIGGEVGDFVGRQIADVARDKQVVCITHLPQIAAYGDRHFIVEKREAKGRVRTEVAELVDKARRDEIARMLGGRVTDKARAHADELLGAASAHKRAGSTASAKRKKR